MGPPVELQDIVRESERLQERRPMLSQLHLLVPFGLFVAAIVVLALYGEFGRVGGALGTSFFVLGKLIILKGSMDNVFAMTAVQLALMVFTMDVWVAYFLTFNIHRVYRLPRVGPWLARLQNYCRYWIVRQPWMRRWAFTGVMLFVMFPLTGTGAPGGAILGRLVGLSALTTLSAIVTGSALGCGLMAAFATELEPIFRDIQQEWWFKAIGIGIIVVLLLLLFWLGRRISRAADEYARSQAAGGDA